MKRFIILLAACNRVYSLESTQLVDGSVDAQPSCDRAIAYVRAVHQVVIQPCDDYAIAEKVDRAFAICRRGGPGFIAEGAIDGPLTEVALSPSKQGAVVVRPRLAPEGDWAIVEQLANAQPSTFSAYRRDAGGAWQWSYDLPIDTDFDETVGVPSRGPHPHVMHGRPNFGQVDELVEDTPQHWTVVRSYPAISLGTLTTYYVFNLSADGLHLIYGADDVQTNKHLFHASRASIDDPFSAGTTLVAIPQSVFGAFMTADCSRIYFSGLDSVFYASQE